MNSNFRVSLVADIEAPTPARAAIIAEKQFSDQIQRI